MLVARAAGDRHAGGGEIAVSPRIPAGDHDRALDTRPTEVIVGDIEALDYELDRGRAPRAFRCRAGPCTRRPNRYRGQRRLRPSCSRRSGGSELVGDRHARIHVAEGQRQGRALDGGVGALADQGHLKIAQRILAVGDGPVAVILTPILRSIGDVAELGGDRLIGGQQRLPGDQRASGLDRDDLEATEAALVHDQRLEQLIEAGDDVDGNRELIGDSPPGSCWSR